MNKSVAFVVGFDRFGAWWLGLLLSPAQKNKLNLLTAVDCAKALAGALYLLDEVNVKAEDFLLTAEISWP